VFQRLLDEPGERGAGQTPKPTLQALGTLVQLLRAYPGGFLQGLTSGKARAAVERFVNIYSRPSLTWEALPFLRERTKLPILLKGILHPDDARRAVEAGMDGIVVSNHGGRQLDGVVSGADALPEVVQAVGDRLDVLVDGGIRRGTDVVKALALGARAVLLGRPVISGLAVGGVEGVQRVLEILLRELDNALGLIGAPRAEELDSSFVAPAPWAQP
jgi:lactate 2-monooxygenase